MRELPRPFLKGLVLILAVGLVVSVLAIAGETLEWATTPDLGAIEEVVLQELQRMDWYREASQDSTAFEPTFRQQYDMGWRFLPFVFGAPNPIAAAVKVITIPLWLEVSWLVFGVLGFLCARLVGGQGSLKQTLGCTALAVAPQMLGLAWVLPYVEVGGAITIWTLICNYLALKTAHRLSSVRAFWATLLPFILLIILILALLGGTGVGLELIFSGARR
jgi:hypothetical protein